MAKTWKKILLNFNVYFDKEKFHKLFFARGISYSEINNKELYLLPILKKMNKFLFIMKIIFMIIGIKFIKMILLSLYYQ